MESYKVILPIGPFSAQKKKKSGVLRLKLSRVHTYCHLGDCTQYHTARTRQSMSWAKQSTPKAVGLAIIFQKGKGKHNPRWVFTMCQALLNTFICTISFNLRDNT